MANYEEMKNEIIEAYTNLLEVQYNGLPNAYATIKLHCETLLANMVLWQIRDGFDIDTAVGNQLDIIGDWEVVDRYYQGSSYENQLWLAYFDWADNTQPNALQGCYKDWNNEVDEDGAYVDYGSVISTTNKLDDESFRIILKLKAAKNNMFLTNKNIDDKIHEIFGDLVYTTWGVQEVTYNYNNSVYNIIKLAELKNCLLVPSGCNLILNEV